MVLVVSGPRRLSTYNCPDEFNEVIGKRLGVTRVRFMSNHVAAQLITLGP